MTSPQAIYHRPQQLTTVGWLPRLKHWIVGKRDPIEQQLHEVERQGHGMARIMHAAGYLMLVLFSVGSAIGICGTLVQKVVANGPLTWQSLPNDVVITVSLMLVFCMDLAAIYAAFHMRLLATRHAPWQQYIIHALVLLTCTVLEGGTFIQMSFEYDNVIAGTVALLIIARGIVAPLLSVYLNMARPIPSGVADIAYQSFLGAGQGVVRDIIHIANDPNASLADKAELMSASAYINQREQAQLDRLIDVARRREERRLPAPHAHIVAASATLPPEMPPMEHHTDVYKAMHDWADDGEILDEVEDESDLFSTRKMPAVHVRVSSSPKGVTGGTKQRTRSGTDSGPTRGNGDRSKSLKKANAELREEAKRLRRSKIRDAVYSILDEWYASGQTERLSDKELTRRVQARVDFDVNPSGNTVARWRGPWQSSRAHKAALLDGISNEVPDEVEPMEPQELRELQEAW